MTAVIQEIANWRLFFRICQFGAGLPLAKTPDVQLNDTILRVATIKYREQQTVALRHLDKQSDGNPMAIPWLSKSPSLSAPLCSRYPHKPCLRLAF